MAEQTQKRLMTTDDEIREVTAKKHLQLPIVIGAAKDDEMKIFEIITLKRKCVIRSLYQMVLLLY